MFYKYTNIIKIWNEMMEMDDVAADFVNKNIPRL